MGDRSRRTSRIHATAYSRAPVRRSVGQHIVVRFAGCYTMEWKIGINKKNRYVEVITRGIANKENSLNIAKAISHTMKTNRITKALIDHSNLVSVTGDTVDIYDRPKYLKIVGLILGVKIAEVIKPEHMEHFRFFETVCVNRG